MNKEIKNWLNMAEYDLVTAEEMFKTKRYVYVIFMCHMAIEKTLKAVIVQKIKEFPPKTHDLIYLLKLAEINLPNDLLDFLGMINNASVVTRYPEDLSKLISSYPGSVAKTYLKNTREVVACIKKNPNLKK